MNLAILGATGSVVRQIVTQALAAEHDVTVLVRSQGPLRPIRPSCHGNSRRRQRSPKRGPCRFRKRCGDQRAGPVKGAAMLVRLAAEQRAGAYE